MEGTPAEEMDGVDHGNAMLDGLEEDQRRVKDLLGELERAVGSVEGSLKENGDVVKKNVASLEDRISQLTERLDKLSTY